VTHSNARALLGDEKWERLQKDRVRFLGPTANTIYPWNIVDYMQDIQRERPAPRLPEPRSLITIKAEIAERKRRLAELEAELQQRKELDGLYPFTVTIAGLERYDGEAPYTYVVDAPDALEATRVVFQHMKAELETDDLEVKSCTPGVPPADCWYHWNDLRGT
jgi:hypothetical protein